MSTVMPQNELHHRAVQWIADEQREHPQKKLHDLIDEAGMRFNLGPQDCRFLLELWKGAEGALPPQAPPAGE